MPSNNRVVDIESNRLIDIKNKDSMAERFFSTCFMVFVLSIGLLASTSEGFSSQTNMWTGKRSVTMERRAEAGRKEICGMCYQYCKPKRKRFSGDFRLDRDLELEDLERRRREARPSNK